MQSDIAASTWQSLYDARWNDKPCAAPAVLQDWLSDQGSLTEKLTSQCKERFRVQLLHQTLAYASLDAARVLGVDEGASLLHREVLLCDGDRPLVFACSLLPELALTGPYEELRQLDERPLGHWIFAEPALQRDSMSYICMDLSSPLFVRLERNTDDLPDYLWGRATTFIGAAASLLVSEFFLFDS